ncbi:MAG: glycosyltransferase [Desulfomonile tiedjei]|uniref:Glycosyltransferase n=1 Tax=Desulfomonile tiedjei TaxID=2358 RepID=A0A9D6Z3V8_9BACT|nr:glycosyltransferase [Desulfomonile tiedjei]
MQSVSRLCEGLAEVGARVEVVAPDTGGRNGRLDVPIGVPCDVDGIRVTYLKTYGPWRFYCAPELVRMLFKRGREFDLIHVSAFFSFFHIGPLLTPGISGTPIVLSPRGSLMPNALERGKFKKAAYSALIERPLLRKYTAVHCASDQERIAVERHMPGVPAFVVPNGLNVQELESLPGRGRLRRSLNIDDDSFVFVFLGRLHAHKGLDLTIKALSVARKSGISIDLIVAGPEELSTDRPWRVLASQMGVEENVHFIGPVYGKDKLQTLADADAFVLNSHSENFGMSIAEALVCGLPVLISDQTGLSGWVSRNDAGLVVPQDVDSIAESMLQMAHCREKFREAALKCREVARKTFDHLRVAQKMLEQYEAIISKGRPVGD